MGLLREQQDHDKESKLAQNEIRELKDELQKNRTISEIEYKFEEKKLRAQEQALIRIHAQREKRLVEELEELQDAQGMENTAHENARDFLDDKLKKLQDLKEQWSRDHERESSDREMELISLKEKRTNNQQEQRTVQEWFEETRTELMDF